MSIKDMEEVKSIGYEGDFRGDAIVASIRFCQQAGFDNAPHDLTQLGISLCLPASENPGAQKRAIRSVVAISYSIMVALLLCGGALIVAAIKGPLITPIGAIRIPIWMGIIPAAAGWVMMCASVNTEHWIVRRRIAARGTEQLPFPISEKRLMFRIENPATFRVIKLLIDDVAIVWCDASRGVMQLEGYAYRYVIWGKDIISLNRLGDRFVEVKFCIAGSNEFLTLAVAMNGAGIELKKQLSFGTAKRAVEAPLSRVFGLPIAWFADAKTMDDSQQIP